MMPDSLSEAEIQVLIALLELVEPVETPNNGFYSFFPKTIEEAARYFRELKVDWTDAYGSLEAKGLLLGTSLTDAGIARARPLREERPPNYYWYELFYAQAPLSKAFAEFCELLYGKALCQDGFSDMAQVDAMLDAARVGKDARVLDMGCGPGMISEYIHDARAARVTGLDYSRTAIERAKERTKAKRDRLSFIEGNFDSLPFPPASFDVILSIDTLYMPNDLNATLASMRSILAPGGRMAAFYSHPFENSPEALEARPTDSTPLGKTLKEAGLEYRAMDFSAENHRFLQRKHIVAKSLRGKFASEDRLYLYDYLIEQSEGDPRPFDRGAPGMRRYLYLTET
jgi:ubiquinone/menaquinone biosynthesis C-methylase UbiE